MTSVLIVDDAPAVRDGLRRLVSTLPGVRAVALASSGEEALSRYVMERPDLVLLDVRMPGMSGLECARRLLHSDPGVRIVMLTAGEDPQAVATAAARLSEALRRAGPNPTRTKVVDALNGINHLDLGGLELGFSPTDHTGLNYVELSIIGRDGRFQR